MGSATGYWLIVSAPGDQTAEALTGALRQTGQRAVLVDQPATIEAYAGPDAVCVAISASREVPAAITRASELRCAMHLAVLIDDGPLPPGSARVSAMMAISPRWSPRSRPDIQMPSSLSLVRHL